MTMIYYDGSFLNCNEIYVGENEFIVDDIYSVPILEIQRIVGD